MKAFAYLRVSSVGQIDGDGYDRQIEACQKWAASNDAEIVEIFKEKGVSGTKDMDDRPALSELMVALEENGVNTLIIEKLDRLARDLLIQETIIQDIQKRGFVLVSTCEPDLCSNDPSRVLMRQIFGAIAQYDRAMLTAKLRAARVRMKKREGRCEGVKRYGDNPKKPAEASSLEMMKSLRAAGLSCEKIAEALNANGIPARRGGPWRGDTINRIMKREDV